MASKRFGSEAPYKAPLTGSGGVVSLSWLAWLNNLTRATTLIIVDAPADPPNLVAGAVSTVSMTANGAALGDFATASFSLPNAGVSLLAQVTAANTVSVTFWNTTAGAINLAAGTLRVRIEVNK